MNSRIGSSRGQLEGTFMRSALKKAWARATRGACAAFAILGISSESSADSYAPANSHVTQIASAQLFKQNAVIFKLDQGNSDCPAGSYVYYYSTNTDDLNLMYASVLAAYLPGAPLIVHFPTTGS
jgi:hypothetical protein